eukprot:8316671-Pyramimonas_sp.AAC.1
MRHPGEGGPLQRWRPGGDPQAPEHEGRVGLGHPWGDHVCGPGSRQGGGQMPPSPHGMQTTRRGHSSA